MKKILVLLAMIGFIGQANALNSITHVTNPSQTRYIVEHDNGYDTSQVLIVLGVGIIAGLIIYNIATEPRCENGLICTRF